MTFRPISIDTTLNALSVLMASATVLSVSVVHAAEWEQPYPKLGACTRRDSMAFSARTDPLYAQCMTNVGDESYCSALYPAVPLPYDQWASTYHGTIDRIVEDFIGQPSKETLALRPSPSGPAMCSSGGGPEPASPLLTNIAVRLEPWTKGSMNLRQSDTAPVLLEYLRVYECSLIERSVSLPIEIWREESERRRLLPGGLAFPLFFTQILEISNQQLRDIQRELKTARPTLHRTLEWIGTINMTRSIGRDTECIQRASLDIRNAIALSADTASCLPRIWNAKDPLRDPTPCSDGRDNDGDGQTDLRDNGCSSLIDMSE